MIVEGDRYRLINDGRILEIHDVEDSDKGDYTCNASNVAGSDVATGSVLVLGELSSCLSNKQVGQVVVSQLYSFAKCVETSCYCHVCFFFACSPSPPHNLDLDHLKLNIYFEKSTLGLWIRLISLVRDYTL